MGILFKTAEFECKEQKAKNNEARKQSIDPKIRFLYVLTNRTAETRAMAAEVSSQLEEIKSLKELIENMFYEAKSQGAFKNVLTLDDY